MTARKVLRTIKEAFQAEFGKPEKRRNPWPLCGSCYHRTPPPLCLTCAHCQGCCEKCETCGRCVLGCGGHKEAQR